MSIRSWFCKHEHVAIVKTVVPSTQQFYGAADSLVRIAFGEPERTMVLLRCPKCGDVQKHEMLGREATS